LEMMKQRDEQTWAQQFKHACMLSPQVDEEGNVEDISGIEAALHFCSIGWKVFLSLIPPPRLGGGWFAFVLSLIFIGLITAVVGEFANLFGCVIGLKPSVTAISFVALGTSLPDTFASKQAAEESDNADSAIGNVTGSNSVNVFLGLGLPWIMAAIYYQNNEHPTGGFLYKVPAGELGFSVFLFLIVSLLCVATLVIRRKVSLIIEGCWWGTRRNDEHWTLWLCHLVDLTLGHVYRFECTSSIRYYRWILMSGYFYLTIIKDIIFKSKK
jgi:solute carrier family 8 (sodium/calcium exchanger)